MQMCVEMYKLQLFNNPLQFVIFFCLVILQLLLVKYTAAQYFSFISFFSLLFIVLVKKSMWHAFSQIYALDFSSFVSFVCAVPCGCEFSQTITEFIFPLTFSEARELAYGIGFQIQ